MAKFLLDKGADPNSFRGTDGQLHKATSYGYLNMIRLLLEHDADPTRDVNGWCPLTNATNYKNTEAITLLLQVKISDPVAHNAWLESSLRYASRVGERGAVLQLLREGANVDAVEEKSVPKGATPLLLAILNGHVKAAQLLIHHGARHDLTDEEGRLPLPSVVENGYDLLVRDLLRAGAKPNLKSGPNEDTPLILAVAKEHEKVI
jgi:ankyrin repeat protein